MKKWEKFEKQCTDFINDKAKDLDIRITSVGGSDSNEPDIKCQGKNGEIIIEVKMRKAQASQFVLLPNDDKKCFNYSPRNHFLINDYSETIINHLNAEYEKYKNAGTKGTAIIGIDEALYVWCINRYKIEKKSDFIISQNAKGELIIVKTDEMRDYFNISATYRAKKSGSDDPANKDYKIIEELLRCKGINFSNLRKNGKHCEAEINGKPDNFTIEYEPKDFYFKKREKQPNQPENLYRITKLSNTCNSNVILSISMKDGVTQNNTVLDEFVNSLKKIQ